MPKENSVSLRAKLGDRTYEAAVKLLGKGALIEKVDLSPTASYMKFKDAGTKVVLCRAREDDFDATCDCSKKPMGCKHCAAAYMIHLGFKPGVSVQDLEAAIDEFSKTSFDYRDYDVDLRTAMTQFYNYMQEVLDRKVKHIVGAIKESGISGDELERVQRLLWDAAEGFESPHDEWSRGTMHSLLGIDYYDRDD